MEQNIETTMIWSVQKKNSGFARAVSGFTAATSNFCYNPIRRTLPMPTTSGFEFSALLPAIALFSILSFAVIFLLICLLPKKGVRFRFNHCVFLYALALH